MARPHSMISWVKWRQFEDCCNTSWNLSGRPFSRVLPAGLPWQDVVPALHKVLSDFPADCRRGAQLPRIAGGNAERAANCKGSSRLAFVEDVQCTAGLASCFRPDRDKKMVGYRRCVGELLGWGGCFLHTMRHAKYRGRAMGRAESVETVSIHQHSGSEGMATSSSLQLLAITANDGAEVGRDCAWNFVGGLSGLISRWPKPGDAMLSLPSLQDFVKALQANHQKISKGLPWSIGSLSGTLGHSCRCWILWSSTKQPESQFQKSWFLDRSQMRWFDAAESKSLYRFLQLLEIYPADPPGRRVQMSLEKLHSLCIQPTSTSFSLHFPSRTLYCWFCCSHMII